MQKAPTMNDPKKSAVLAMKEALMKVANIASEHPEVITEAAPLQYGGVRSSENTELWMLIDRKSVQARIEELEAFAQLVIEELDVAALDDCESGVASVNAKLAGQYLNDYRHTREATYKLRGKAAKILEGTNDE